MSIVAAMKTSNVYSKACSSREILAEVSHKWVILIMGILERGPVRFGSLRREIEGISQKMLTQSLRTLERDGLVKREVYAEVPVRVEYSLTDLGRSLNTLLKPVATWAEVYVEQIRQVQQTFDENL